jgi:hypothetical protein
MGGRIDMATQKSEPSMPSGFEERTSTLGPTWPKEDTKTGDILTGIIKERKKGKYKSSNYVLEGAALNSQKIVDADGKPCDLMVWGSAVLEGKLQDAVVGDVICIVKLDDLPPRTREESPMKMFKVGIKK